MHSAHLAGDALRQPQQYTAKLLLSRLGSPSRPAQPSTLTTCHAGQPMLGCRLMGSGSSVPEARLTNDDLTRLVDTNDEWIATRTGRQCRPCPDHVHAGTSSSKSVIVLQAFGADTSCQRARACLSTLQPRPRMPLTWRESQQPMSTLSSWQHPAQTTSLAAHHRHAALHDRSCARALPHSALKA